MFFAIASVALGLISYSIWLELLEQKELIAERDRIIERLTIQNINDGPPSYQDESYQDGSYQNGSYQDGSYQDGSYQDAVPPSYQTTPSYNIP